jgi:membrane-bound lytic murein transglycosylase B
MSTVFHLVFHQTLRCRPSWRTLTALLPLLAATAGPVHAQVYTSVSADDDEAPVVLSNFSSAQTPVLVVAPALTTPLSGVADDKPAAAARTAPAPTTPRVFKTAPAVPAHLLPMFTSVAIEQAVPASLLLAVAAAESGFNSRAVSPKGALGMMQLMPATARRHGVRQVWSVLDNLRGGAAHLRLLLTRFSGQQALALAAYNAGEQAVLNAGSQIPPFDETRHYVPKVMAWQAQYEQLVATSRTTAAPRKRLSESAPSTAQRLAAMADINNSAPHLR